MKKATYTKRMTRPLCCCAQGTGGVEEPQEPRPRLRSVIQRITLVWRATAGGMLAYFMRLTP
jgi:hypothetical protein